ncbi:MAG TPA: hypothetical protein VGB05_07100, partial [Pyrinomonadaceae bacterium]
MTTPTDQPFHIAHPDQGQPSQESAAAIMAGGDPASNGPSSPDDPPWGLPAATGVLLGSLA